MTYSTTFQKFTLATECDSYAPWVENINPHDFDNDTLAECAETAKSWTQDILSHAIDQIEGDFLQSEEYNEEGEEIVRGRTLEEAVEEMREDLPYLEAFLFDFITRDGDDDEVGDDDSDEEDDEPQLMYIISWGELSQGKFRTFCSRIEAEKELYFRAFTSMLDSDAEWVMTTHFEYRDLPTQWEWVGDRYEISDQKTLHAIALTKRPLPIGNSSTTWIYQIDKVTLVAHLIEGLDYESPGLGNGRTIIPPYKPTN